MSTDDATHNENRSDPRQPHRAEVLLRPSDQTIAGHSENVSKEGIMFYSRGDLRVSVEFEGPGGPQKRTGRIVRVNRVSAEETGMAVELDPEPEA